MGDKNSAGSGCIEPIAVVADDQIPMVGIQLMVKPLVFIFDGTNNFRHLHQYFWDEQCSFFGVVDAVAFQGYNPELGELFGQQICYISLPCECKLPSPFKQVTDQGYATGGMPQTPVQWGNQCRRFFYLLISRN